MVVSTASSTAMPMAIRMVRSLVGSTVGPLASAADGLLDGGTDGPVDSAANGFSDGTFDDWTDSSSNVVRAESDGCIDDMFDGSADGIVDGGFAFRWLDWWCCRVIYRILVFDGSTNSTAATYWWHFWQLFKILSARRVELSPQF
jgi:hypothetical protein